MQPHRDAPVFEGSSDEAAEGERRHHAQRECAMQAKMFEDLFPRERQTYISGYLCKNIHSNAHQQNR